MPDENKSKIQTTQASFTTTNALVIPLVSTSYQSLLCQASVMTNFSRKAVMELSPLWLAICKVKQESLYEGKPKIFSKLNYLNDILPLSRELIWVRQTSFSSHTQRNPKQSEDHFLYSNGNQGINVVHRLAVTMWLPSHVFLGFQEVLLTAT